MNAARTYQSILYLTDWQEVSSSRKASVECSSVLNAATRDVPGLPIIEKLAQAAMIQGRLVAYMASSPDLTGDYLIS